MNNVHEPGSRTMSKNLTQEKYRVKPGRKQAKCTECIALASLHAQVARPALRSHAPRVPRAPLPRPLRPCSACLHARPTRARPRAPRAPHARPPGRPPARPPALPTRARPNAPRAPARARACACCAPHLRPAPNTQPNAQPAVSRHGCLPCSLSHNYIAIQLPSNPAYCNTIFLATSSLCVTIHLVYCDTKTFSHSSLSSFILSQYNYCIVLQYKPSQLNLLQHTIPCCNTIFFFTI